MRAGDFIIILLFYIGSTVRINLVGEIALSDIAVVLYFATSLHRKFFLWIEKDSTFRTIAWLYAALLISQLVSELVLANQVTNILKGISVTILSLVKLTFIWYLCKRSPHNIFYSFLCLTLVSIFSIENAEGVTEADILEGESAVAFGFFKFRIAPLIGTSLVCLSLLRPNLKWHILFMLVGLFCIVLGARSTGLMIFMTGMIAFLVLRKRINRRKLIAYGVIGTAVSYLLFVVYVSAVLSGEITSGNSAAQIRGLRNPYNPIYVLLAGRTESPASIAAICDRPLTGFGAWAPDPGYRYHMIQAQFQHDRFDFRQIYTNIIPAHSVVLQTGVNNGVVAMTFVILLLAFFIKRGFKSIGKGNPYTYVTIFCLMQLLWNGLFSPLSHLRGAFPLYFVVCLYSFYFYENFKHHKYATKNIGHYSDHGQS